LELFLTGVRGIASVFATDALATPAPLSDEPVASMFPVVGAGATDMQGNLGVTIATPPVNPSDKQEAVARVVYQRDVDGDTRAFAAWYGNPPEQGTALYAVRETLLDKSITPERAINRVVKMIDTAPLAQSAEQDRIDSERSSKIAKELRKLERYPSSFNQTERSVVLKLAADQLDKGASK
jgi:hypothetical protein